ncbi:MAG: glycosyltransferase family 4 protein [Methanocellales archaeon]|nr:glycosyltransferase family 4 protein [Methanocellales archaeon]
MMIEPCGRGGVCHYTYHLCNALAERADITLITSKNYELDGLRRDFKIKKTFNAIHIFDVVGVFRQLIKEHADIIHFQMLKAPLIDWAFIRSLKLLGLNLVYTAHNVIPHEQRFYTKSLFSNIYSMMDGIIAHTKNDERELRRAFDLSKPKVCVVPHGSYLFFGDEAISKEEAMKTLGIPSDFKTVLFFGYISEDKGLKYLIEAFAGVAKKVPCKLVIAGEPVEDSSTYESLISKLGISHDVILDLGYIPLDMVGCYFTSADVVVLPYAKPYHDVMAQVAHAFGKPAVVTGQSGIVEDERSGYIVKPKSSDELEKAIVKILSDDETRRKMGRRAKRIADANSWDKVAKRTMRLYDSILSGCE